MAAFGLFRCAVLGTSSCARLRSTEPTVRIACKRWSESSITCKSCRRRTPLRSVQTVSSYEGCARELLQRLKFGRARAGATTIAGLLAANLEATGMLITYVPTATVRVRQRGYDQSALIAKEVARQLGLPCLPLLARLGAKRQVGQPREMRKRQMKDAFRPLNAAAANGKRILLVDDVITTGATCEAAARVLKQAGAREVHAAVFAAVA